MADVFDDLDLSDFDMDAFLDDDFDFDFDSDTQAKPIKKTEFARVKRYRRPRTVKYEYAAQLAKDIGRLEEDEHIFSIISGNFIAGDFIEAWLIENDFIAEEIIIATLSVSKDNIDSLKLLQDAGKVDKLGMIVSDYFFSHERKNGIEYIIDELSNGNFYLAAAGIHTKITLIKTECGQHIVIGGSANLRSSRNVEQLTIDNSKVLYDFNREWMGKLLNDYQVNHKSLRGGKLWQLVAAEAKA
jgi:hypothetical protein